MRWRQGESLAELQADLPARTFELRLQADGRELLVTQADQLTDLA